VTGQPNRGAPTPAIAIEGGPKPRFGGGDLDGALLQRLESACAEVRTDVEGRVEASRDWWPLAMTWALKGEVPAQAGAVARPSSVEEISAVLALCNDAGVPVTTAAGRSGVCGASVPVHGGVVLDLTGLAGIVDVDDTSLLLDVRAGTFGDVLDDDLRTGHRVTVGHWPQSMQLSTVGGWLACRGAGQYSTRYGKIEDIVVGLEVVLADGRVICTGGSAPRMAAGPDLTQLFVGSEGTLGVITEARLRLHPAPAAERRAAYGFRTFADGLDACRRILRKGATPAVLRLYDERESKRYTAEGTEGLNVLLVLDEGDRGLIDAVFEEVAEECVGARRLSEDLVGEWLSHRNDVSALEAAIRQGIVVDTTEISARWAALPAIYEHGVAALKAVPGMWVASAHQSHSYTDGACVYFTWAGQPPDGTSGDDFYRAAWDAITTTVLEHGGSLSHHHGVGLNRGRFMADALGPAFDTLVAVKQALDPRGVLNPGKLGLPSPFGDPVW
jgi:alkyldihydroxyacetonephosphate synthase